MTEKQTATVIGIMQTAYPEAFNGKSDDVVKRQVKLWAKIFKDDPFELVCNAVYAHIATSTDRFMPPIGVIKEEIRKLLAPNEMTEEEAWNYVSSALRNGIYGYADEYKRLPERVQRLVGKPEQLRTWAMMDVDTVQSVVASNFKRSYRARKAYDDEYEKLPASVKETYQRLSWQMFKALPESEEGDVYEQT